MIHRYVFVKLKDGFNTAPARVEFARRTQDSLRRIASVRAVVVGTPADPDSEKAWDVSIDVAFTDLAGVEAYLADAEHQRYVDHELSPKAIVIKAWNFAS